MRLNKSAIYTFAALAIAASISSVQAGSVTLSTDRPNGTVHFALNCTFPDGTTSDTAKFTIHGDNPETYDEDGCRNFNVRFFRIAHQGDVTYSLKAGRSYTFQWMGTYWDLFADD